MANKNTKYNWEKIKKDFLKSNLTAKQYCEKHGINVSSFYTKVRIQKDLKRVKKQYKEKLKKQTEKIIERKAETDAEIWVERSLKCKQKNFDILEKQTSLVERFVKQIEDSEEKIDYKELESSVRMSEKLIDISSKLMGVEEDKPDMPKDPYNESTIQVEQELKMDELEEYQKCIEQIEGERKDK